MHISHSIIALERERERERESTVEDEKLFVLLWFYTVLVKFYTEEFLCGFLPFGFPIGPWDKRVEFMYNYN